MKSIKNILCAVDIYDYQPALLDMAKTIAAATGACITPVYVVASLTEYVAFTEPKATVDSMTASMTSGARKDFDAFIKEHFSGENVRGVLLSGKPAEEILAYVEKTRPDMVITATHGRKGMQRIFYGSVAERIIKFSTAPVLTVNMGGRAE